LYSRADKTAASCSIRASRVARSPSLPLSQYCLLPLPTIGSNPEQVHHHLCSPLVVRLVRLAGAYLRALGPPLPHRTNENYETRAKTGARPSARKHSRLASCRRARNEPLLRSVNVLPGARLPLRAR